MPENRFDRVSFAAKPTARPITPAEASHEVSVAEKAIGELTLRAPRDGIFVIEENWREGRKFEVGDDVSFWHHTAARGDVHWIRIGAGTNVQDGAVLHVTHETHPLAIGERVVIGHGAIVHGCTFVARGFAGDIDGLASLIARAVAHRSKARPVADPECAQRSGWRRHRPAGAAWQECTAERAPAGLGTTGPRRRRRNPALPRRHQCGVQP